MATKDDEKWPAIHLLSLFCAIRPTFVVSSPAVESLPLLLLLLLLH